MRILLTGASGFIGRHALSALGEHQIVAVTRRGPDGELPEGVQSAIAELHDRGTLESLLQGCDAVIHLAAVSSLTEAQLDPGQCIETNVAASVRLADLARQAGVERFIYASSALVYGGVSDGVLTEDTPTAPEGVYAMSKLMAEQLISTVLPTATLLRIFNVYGPGQRGTLIPTLVERLRNGEDVTLQGGGTQVRSFLHVDDAVQALRAAVEIGYPGVVNISGFPSSVRDVFAIVRDALGVEAEAWSAPPRPGDPQTLLADHEGARVRIGWEPTIPVLDGVRRTVLG